MGKKKEGVRVTKCPEKLLVISRKRYLTSLSYLAGMRGGWQQVTPARPRLTDGWTCLVDVEHRPSVQPCLVSGFCCHIWRLKYMASL